MLTLAEALSNTLHQPAPLDLIALQEALLAHPARAEPDLWPHWASALETAGQFYSYLAELEVKLTARGFTELASWMDAGALGVVAFQRLLNSDGIQLRQLLMGVLAEGLMVLASRQYVKATEQELALVPQRAAWYLREALWLLSHDFLPDQAPEQRVRIIRQVLAPLDDAQVSLGVRMVLIGCLFQAILQVRVGQLISDGQNAVAQPTE